ncbi:methyl-accepting chemotaxis protein [Clostridium luticellarii]|uniref:Methyl-accepting chemotaxis protein 1 n=1 Tax=Clostridium luticellarii TaxID=1691940 RepID=A0A2T0BR79_9CLOT|nr:methyl-accepting chemotaxis protein [Clostridium luticellarii]PRR86383.1 Methyl-accepting chemotaxis protein 1 [Clostridium luticellarii]
MNFLKNMRVKTKLLTSFLIMALLIALVGISGIMSLQKVAENSEKMYNTNLKNVYVLSEINSSLSNITADIFKVVYYQRDNEEARQEAENDIAADKNTISKFMKEYEGQNLNLDEKTKTKWNLFKIQNDQYMGVIDEITGIVNGGDFARAESELAQNGSSGYIMVTLSEMINLNMDMAKNADISNHLIHHMNRIYVIVLMAIGLIAAVGIGLLISKDLNKPIQLMKKLGEKFSQYDLSYKFEVRRRDELGQACSSFMKAQDNIRKLIGTIVENSQGLSASSQELSATAEELSARSENVGSAINKISDSVQETSSTSEEIAASMQEVDASVSELSNNAAEGTDVAVGARSRATDIQKKGEESIKEIKKIYGEKESNMLKAIEEGKVVSNIEVMADTIADIAEQTNLLALNAAIEAARAGEHGKGFAVVAEEVRKLAEESSKAVSSIKDTIVKVQGAFKNIAHNSDEILAFINENVNPKFAELGEVGNQYYNDSEFISQMSEKIASMSQQLTVIFSQITEAVQNMAQTSQESGESVNIVDENINDTIKSVSQVALTAQKQSELAQKLNEMVGNFKL